MSTTYGGVAYFTSPLRDAERVAATTRRLTVFDTTSGPVAIHVGGRHIIVVGAPNAERDIARSARSTISRTTAP